MTAFMILISVLSDQVLSGIEKNGLI